MSPIKIKPDRTLSDIEAQRERKIPLEKKCRCPFLLYMLVVGLLFVITIIGFFYIANIMKLSKDESINDI